MTKKLIVCICAFVIILALGTGIISSYLEKSKEIDDISFVADYYQYSYDELKEKSRVIALIEVLDELTEKNSEAITSQGYMVGNVGRRQVKVHKYFKDDKNYGDILTILEPASVINNQYIHPHDYDKLEKGNLYFVFLSDDTATKELSLMSMNNGTFDMENLNELDEYYDLAIKSLVEYMTDLPEEQKEEVIHADKIEKSNTIENTDIHAEVLNLKNEIVLNMEIEEDGKIAAQIVE